MIESVFYYREDGVWELDRCNAGFLFPLVDSSKDVKQLILCSTRYICRQRHAIIVSSWGCQALKPSLKFQYLCLCLSISSVRFTRPASSYYLMCRIWTLYSRGETLVHGSVHAVSAPMGRASQSRQLTTNCISTTPSHMLSRRR